MTLRRGIEDVVKAHYFVLNHIFEAYRLVYCTVLAQLLLNRVLE